MSVVLIAGGASGIGLSVMRAFRRQGDDVLLVDINADGARAAAAEDLPGRAAALALDLTDPAAPRQAVRHAVEQLGGLDVVFANAGLLDAAPLAEWTAERWDRTMALNLRAPFLLSQAAAEVLPDGGSIIFTSSTGAFRGHAGMPAYGASKAGLINLARCLADELSPRGIRVNAICPGWIDTPFNDAFWQHQADPDAALRQLTASIPMRRQGEPDDVAGTVLFLASPAAGYITGQAFVIDGGYSAV